MGANVYTDIELEDISSEGLEYAIKNSWVNPELVPSTTIGVKIRLAIDAWAEFQDKVMSAQTALDDYLAE